MTITDLIFNVSTYLTLITVVVALGGDYMVETSRNPVLKAINDNLTHGLIGGLSWMVYCVKRRKSQLGLRHIVLEVVLCTLLSSLIDLDHFVAAKSVLLKDATSLNHRPFLHCSTGPLFLAILFILTSYIMQWPLLQCAGFMVWTAFASHHLRDATRRGLWFCPFGSTSSIPYGLYIVLVCLVPYIVVCLDTWVKADLSGSGVDYSVLV